jgi:hypothetical protein
MCPRHYYSQLSGFQKPFGLAILAFSKHTTLRCKALKLFCRYFSVYRLNVSKAALTALADKERRLGEG